MSKQTTTQTIRTRIQLQVWLLPLLILVLGIVLSAATARWEHAAKRASVDEFLAHETALVTTTIEDEFDRASYGLRGARGMIAASGSVNHDQFLAYVNARDLPREFPGIRGFGFIERVAPDDLQAYQTRARATDAPGFTIQHLDPRGSRDLFIVRYIEPIAANQGALGLNAGSEPMRLEAIQKTIDTARVTMSAPIQLVQDTRQGPGVLLFVPVYRGNNDPGSLAARSAELFGLLYAPVVISELLDANTEAYKQHLCFDLYDAEKAYLLYRHRVQDNQENCSEQATQTTRLRIAGRSLDLHTAVPMAIEAEYIGNGHYWIFAGGTLASLMAGFFLYQLLASKLRSDAQAARMTDAYQRANKALETSLQSTRSILDSVPDGLIVLDPDGRIRGCNQGILAQFGYQQSELLGQSVELLLPERFRQSHPITRLRFLQNPDWSSITLRRSFLAATRDGREFPVDLGFSQLGEGPAMQVICTIRDISERKRIQDEIEQLKGHYQLLFNGSPDAYLVVEPGTGLISDCNHATEVMLGGTRDQIIGMTPAQLSPPMQPHGRPSHEAAAERIEECLRQGSCRFEWIHRRLNGEDFWVEVAASTMNTDERRVLFVAWRDISDRKQLERSNANLQQLLNRSPDFIGYADSALNVRFINAGGLALAGYPADTDPSALRIADLHSESTADWLQTDVIPEVMQKGYWRGESSVRTTDNRIIPVDQQIFRLEDAFSGERLLGTVMRDETATRAHEAQLIAAREAAESANAAKSTFLATISHEIRTPLNVMIGTTYLLGQTELSQQQRADLKTIESSGKSLLALINDVLDLSKIEAGDLVLEHHPFSLAEIVRDLKAMFAGLAAAKGIELALPDPDRSSLPWLMGDGNRLRQCLINLLGNAVKFTEQGKVTLEIDFTAAPEPAALQRLRFTVIDTGIGIQPDHLRDLFAPFVQADISTSRKFGGTGLGLSIVKRLTDMMRGELGVDSTPGVGSRFWLEIPFEASHLALTSTESSLAARPLHVLVVADDSSEDRFPVSIANDFGWSIEMIGPADDAVACLLDYRTQGYPIDCIVLDWPVSEGIGKLGDLSRYLETDASIPAVIMTTEDDQNGARTALGPMHPLAVLPKPVDPSALFNTINAAMIAYGHRTDHLLGFTRICREHGHWLPGVRVLVVDDNRLNLDLIGRILHREAAETTLCESGAQALDAVRTSQEPFDVVLMDLQMPGLDGCQTTEQLRRDGYRSLPIIALTAGATLSERQRAHAAGMDDFLTKPVDPSKLIRLMRQRVENTRGTALPLKSTKVHGEAHGR